MSKILFSLFIILTPVTAFAYSRDELVSAFEEALENQSLAVYERKRENNRQEREAWLQGYRNRKIKEAEMEIEKIKREMGVK